MFVLEVSELVSQHGIHFGRRQLGQKGVVENDPSGRAKSGEIGVGMG